MSDSSLRLSYKFQRLREAIRTAIDSGEMAQKLPGERELARRFGFNAKTISKALSDLTSEGILVRHVGRGTFVAGQGEIGPRHMACRQYLWIVSEDLQQPWVQTSLALARQRLESHGHRLESEWVELGQDGELPERCVPVGRLKELSGVVIFASKPSWALLADLNRRHLPVVLLYAPSVAIKTNSVCPDYVRAMFELTEHLVLLGHSRIQLVLDEGLQSVSDQAERGYHTALRRHQLASQPPPVRCSPSEVGGLPDSAGAVAFLCVGGKLAAALGGELERSGLGVAGRGSLAGLAVTDQEEFERHSITAYEFVCEQMVDWGIQLLFEAVPGASAREVIVPGVFCDRGSTRSSQRPGPVSAVQHVVL